MKKKILFFVNEDWYFISHRLKLAEYLIRKGYEVSLCCKDTGKLNFIKNKDINCYKINVKRKSLSVFQFIYELMSLIKIIKIVKPEIVHLISLRIITIGIISSLFVNSKFFSTFTGMGFLFINKGIKGFVLKKLIIICLKFCLFIKRSIIIVQNKDDEKLFKRYFNFKNTSVYVIRGSGVDLKFYKHFPEMKKQKIRIAYAGRILKDKGIFSMIESFKKAKIKIKNIELFIAGPLDEKNPSCIKKCMFDKLIKSEDIHYLGTIKNIKQFWINSHIAILLSEREGLPLSLLEAASIGRPIISSDVPGSREIAINGYNSINIASKDTLACSEAIIKLAKNKKLRDKFGKNSRKLVESDLALEHICDQYYRLYRNKI